MLVLLKEVNILNRRQLVKLDTALSIKMFDNKCNFTCNIHVYSATRSQTAAI